MPAQLTAATAPGAASGLHRSPTPDDEPGSGPGLEPRPGQRGSLRIAALRAAAGRHQLALLQLLVLVGISLVALVNRHAALPPLHATPIWLPAGLMVLAGIAMGPRVLPTLFLVGLYQGWPTITYAWRSTADGGLGDALPTVVLGATMLGMGAVGIGLVAWLAGRRLLTDPTELSASRALLALVAVGPVACLASSALGVGELVLTGTITHANVGTSWLVWWSGDALGAMLLAPLAVLLQPSPARTRTRNARDARRTTLVAVVMGTTALIVATYALVEHVQVQRVKASFRDDVRADAQRVQDHVGDIVASLDRSHLRVVQHPPLPSTPAPVTSAAGHFVLFLPADAAPARWRSIVAGSTDTAFVDASGARNLGSSARLFEPVYATTDSVGVDDFGPLVGFVQERTTVGELLGDDLRRADRHVVVQVGRRQPWMAVSPRHGNLVDPSGGGSSGATYASPEAAADAHDVLAVARMPVQVLDQRWTVVAGANDHFITGHSFSTATVPLAVLSIALALFAGTVVLVISGSRARLELEIMRRTRQLRQSEQRYRHVVETSEQGIVHVDAAGVVTFANKAWPLVVGAFADDDAVGQELARYLDPASARAFDVARARILQGESNVETLQLDIAASASPDALVELVAMPFELDDDTPGILVTITAVPPGPT